VPYSKAWVCSYRSWSATEGGRAQQVGNGLAGSSIWSILETDKEHCAFAIGERLLHSIQLTKYGKPEEGLRLAEIAEPGDPGSGSKSCDSREYAPINDSDLLVASGSTRSNRKLPSVVGNEGAGKVPAVVTACRRQGRRPCR